MPLKRNGTPEELAEMITNELSIYKTEIIQNVNLLSKQAIQDLVKRTKRTAPKGNSKEHFRDSISSKKLKTNVAGDETYVWYVKAPNYRLTHLLVHGHALRQGGRAKADPFLENAMNEIIPAYTTSVEEAIKGGKD